MRTMLIVFLMIAAGTSAIATETRVALVIGNSRYTSVSDLANPANDAADIGAALETAGFRVSRVMDADFETMRRQLARFGYRAAEAEVAVIYFAGHGMELSRRNYLLPVDAELRDLRDVTFHGVPLDLLREAARPASRLSLVIVDACRNNPFLEVMTSTGRALSRGLVRVSARGQNELVAFAAREGTIAEDGKGRNSPYAAALSAALVEPGLEIGKLFRRVRDEVIARTGGRQEPALYGSLSEADFFFLAPVEAEGERRPAATSDTTKLDASLVSRTAELTFWDAIAESKDPRDFEDYLLRFPDGLFEGLAKRRLEQISAERSGAPMEGRVTSQPKDAAVTIDTGTRDDERISALLAEEPPESRARAEPFEGEPAAKKPQFRPSRSQIRDAQARLNILGHDAGAVDGLAGRRTAAAVSRYQASRNLDRDGRLSEDLIAALQDDVSSRRLSRYLTRLEEMKAAARQPHWPFGRWCERTESGRVTSSCTVVVRKNETQVVLAYEYLGKPSRTVCLHKGTSGAVYLGRALSVGEVCNSLEPTPRGEGIGTRVAAKGETLVLGGVRSYHRARAQAAGLPTKERKTATIVTRGTALLRSGPSTDHAVVGQIGGPFEAELLNPNEKGWIRFRRNGRTSYIALSDIRRID